MTSIDQARRAKEKLRKLLSARRDVCGLGLTRIGEQFALEVLVGGAGEEPEEGASLPREVDGVPIVVRRVGTLKAQEDQQ